MKNKSIILGLIVVIIGIVYFATNSSSDKPFDTSTKKLVEAKPTEIVELKNGDSYNLTASIVKKVIAGVEVKMLAYNGSIP